MDFFSNEIWTWKKCDQIILCFENDLRSLKCPVMWVEKRIPQKWPQHSSVVIYTSRLSPFSFVNVKLDCSWVVNRHTFQLGKVSVINKWSKFCSEDVSSVVICEGATWERIPPRHINFFQAIQPNHSRLTSGCSHQQIKLLLLFAKMLIYGYLRQIKLEF